MSNNGCKIGLLILAAVLIGALGFASGFATRSVMAAMLPTGVDRVEVPEERPPLAGEGTGTQPTDAPDAPATVPPTRSPSETEVDPETFALFWEVWNIVQDEYYGEVPTDDEITFGAIRGLLNSLDDPFTAFVEPRTAAIMREDMSGSFEGIGAFVTMRDGMLVIVSTFEGQPAERAGLRSEDIVIQVDDTPIENMSVYEAISLIRGPAGTQVRLKVMRDGAEPFDVELTRARIEVPLVEAEMRPDGIAYVTLFEFDSNATARLADEIENLLAQQPTGLILDLRNNPGGLLSEAVMTPGLFLPEDTLVLLERFKDGSERPYATEGDPLAGEIPMVVLVNQGSASASEIVAGALQDHGRATLIGEKTFGKGSVQLVHELSNGAQLRVTVARWFTPADRAIHGEGLEPDIVVEMTPEDVEADRDPQLERAVEYLLTRE